MSEIIEGKPQLTPGVCFICELSNPVRYIDTLRDFYGIVKERIDGRKYICEECVEDAAKKFGFVTPKEAQKLHDRLQVQADFIAELRADQEKYADLKAVIEHFGGKAQVAVTPKGVTAKKVPAKAA